MSTDSSSTAKELRKKLIGVAGICIVASIGAILAIAVSDNRALSQLALALVAALTVAAGVVAFRDRSRRELSQRRRRGFNFVLAGFIILYAFPALLLVAAGFSGAWVGGGFLKVGVCLAAPMFTAAALHLMPVAPISAAERRIALLDFFIALLAFLAILAQFRRDEFAAADHPVVIGVILVAQALGGAGVVWLITRNQFAPVLGATQLWLWWLWALIFLGSDLLAVEVGDHGFNVPLAIAIVGVIVAGWCGIAAAMRPPDDAQAISDVANSISEPVSQTLDSQRSARFIPFTPPLLAVGVFMWELASGNQIGTFALVVAVAATLLLILQLVQIRGDSPHEAAVDSSSVSQRDLVESTEQQWFKALVNESNDVVTLVDAQGNIGYQSPSVARVLGHSPTSWSGHPFMELVAANDRAAVSAAVEAIAKDQLRSVSLEMSLLSRAGGYIHTESTISPVIDAQGPLSGYVVTSRDVTDALRIRELLDARADADMLTGLANLAALRRDTNRALAQSDPDTVGIIAIDLNGFRAVNDSLGHSVGDEVLTIVADGLARCVRPWDVVSRIGGDEFGILVVGHQIDRSATLIFERIQRFLSALVLSDGRVIVMSASAGYSVNDLGHEGAEGLLRNADLALSRARSTSHMEILRFEHHMHDALLQRVHIENQLRQAFADNEFVMHFQPIVRLPSRRITGAEALLRWNHPERGLLSAYEFIEQIDDLGLGGDLRALAVDRAVAALASISKQHPYDGDFNLSFNISADQLTGQLLADLGSALDRHGAPSAQLTVEVTESAIASVQEATTVLERINSLGLKIAIDDFGVGYSSLGYLAHFPVDYIKIDRSFVQGIDSKPNLERLTEAIVVLGEALSSPPVVEGVETEAELEAIMKAGARYAQGWLFAKAMPLAELLVALDRQGEYGPDSSSAFAQQPILDFASDL